LSPEAPAVDNADGVELREGDKRRASSVALVVVAAIYERLRGGRRRRKKMAVGGLRDASQTSTASRRGKGGHSW